MRRTALVLRPEPGAGETAARLAAAGFAVRRCPLFGVEPVAWRPPDTAHYDALLLTSANAARHAGIGLTELAALPVLAVGEATARAARAVGLSVALTGDADAVALTAAASARGWRRLLHLAGRDRGMLPDADQVTVYASDPLPLAPSAVAVWRDHVALLHSPRAARRFAALVDAAGLPRAALALAALSPAVAEAAGPGWAALAIAARPCDRALITAARPLIDPPAGPTDKQA